MSTMRVAALAGLAMVAGVACSDDPMDPGPMDVSIDFAAAINGSPFACGSSYTNVGASQTTITPVDFRIYIHDVELITSGGDVEPVELDQTSFQRDDLVLLDFENGTGPCVNGTATTNTTVEGEVARGDYTGIRFVLGVPFEMNHGEPTTAAAPLDITGLFWSWNGGYKFLRMDHVSDDRPQGWNVHLGSTGCTPTGDPSVPATTCSNPHRVAVELSNFDPESDVVVADLGMVLKDSDLSQNQAGAPGCMSFPGDPECHQVMPNLGLSYEGTAASSQVLFSVQ